LLAADARWQYLTSTGGNGVFEPQDARRTDREFLFSLEHATNFYLGTLRRRKARNRKFYSRGAHGASIEFPSKEADL
jgi:hypothetical protein